MDMVGSHTNSNNKITNNFIASTWGGGGRLGTVQQRQVVGHTVNYLCTVYLVSTVRMTRRCSLTGISSNKQCIYCHVHPSRLMDMGLVGCLNWHEILA